MFLPSPSPSSNRRVCPWGRWRHCPAPGGARFRKSDVGSAARRLSLSRRQRDLLRRESRRASFECVSRFRFTSLVDLLTTPFCRILLMVALGCVVCLYLITVYLRATPRCSRRWRNNPQRHSSTSPLPPASACRRTFCFHVRYGPHACFKELITHLIGEGS